MPADWLRHVWGSLPLSCSVPGGSWLPDVGQPALEVWVWEEQLDWEKGTPSPHLTNLGSNPRTYTNRASPAHGLSSTR